MSQYLDQRPLDVAIVMFDFGPTGVVRNALRIAGAARRAGLRIELWVAQDKGTLRSEVPADVPVVSFGATLGCDYTRADRRRAGRATVPALACLLDDRQPAVLMSAGNHFHSFAADAVRAAIFPTRLLLRISTGLPLPQQQLSPYRWARYLYKKGKAQHRHAVADRLIAVSHEIARELHRDLGADPTTIVTIPNGIDQPAIEKSAAKPFDHDWFAPGAPPVVLGVGRIDKFKNFELLIAAFAKLRSRQPLRLMILGEERSAWRHRLEALAERLGVAADVRFEGFTANPHPFFRHSATYVCCSRYEGMSNAMLEAMANGCPVVATRTATGASELLEGGKLGPLSAPTAAALADAIEARIAAPRDSLRLQARAAEFDLATTIAAYVELLAEEAGRMPLERPLPEPESRKALAA